MCPAEDKSTRFSPDEFAEFIITKLREKGEERPLIYDRASFAVVQEDADGHAQQVFGLSNLFEEYTLADRQAQQHIVDRYVGLFSGTGKNELPSTFKQAMDRLMPVVRDRFQYQAMQIRLALKNFDRVSSDELLDEEFAVCHQPVGEAFAVGIGYDLPDSMIQITSRQLKEWDVSFETALEAAVSNLRSCSRDEFIEAVEGVFISPYHDSYDLSRILVHDLIARVPVKGRPVALMPNSENLIITGSDDVSGLASVLNVIEPLVERPRSMPGIPIVLEKGVWSPYTVSNPELAERFNVLKVSAAARAYSEQRMLIDEWYRMRKKALAVAPFLATQRKDGTVSSCTIWPEGVATLLPIAQSCVLTSGSSFEAQDIVACASFEKVLAVAALHLKKTEFYPELLLADSFPSAVELAKIGMEMSVMK